MPLLAFAEFADAYHARWTVVRMWAEGWNKKSIAGCLKMARSHVYAIIDAFARDGFAGLEEHRTQPPPHPDTQLTLPFLKEVLDLQQAYPRAGRFRIQGSRTMAERPRRAGRGDRAPTPAVSPAVSAPPLVCRYPVSRAA
jgi:hypothetical protein